MDKETIIKPAERKVINPFKPSISPNVKPKG